MKFGIFAGIIFQAIFGLLFLESLKTSGFTPQVAVFAFCVLLGYILTLLCGSIQKWKTYKKD